MFECGEQGFLGQVLGERHVAQHPRQAGDQPGLFDPPNREDGAMRARMGAAAVMTADRCLAGFGLTSPANGESAHLAGAFPARHQVLVELHELLGRGERLFLAGQFENRIAADHFLGLDERAIDDAELAVVDAHLRAGGERHQPAIVEHAAGLDLAVGELAHGLEQFRRRRARMGGFNDEHEPHEKTPL